MTSWFQTSRFDADIEKATSEKNTTELWDVIMTVCDRIKITSAAKEGLKGIVKRLYHTDPHVVVQAITLLDACVINCGKPFHLEVASRDFETEFKKLLTKHEHPIPLKLKLALKKWAEGDFKDDPQLDLIPSLYKKLKSEGHDFTDLTPPKTAQVTFSKDPNVVSSQREEEDIAKAIELSLQETKSSPKTQTQSLYPSVPLTNSTLLTTPVSEPRTVRALYDFEAAEDNELTFVAGEIIQVIDDSDQNWWKGSSKRGEGLFPSNFVTADLSVEPESVQSDSAKNKKSVQFSDEQKDEKNEIQLDIDEDKIDRLFHLLSEANPEDPSQDTEEMLILENQVNQMGPLIDAELERVDRKHAQLTQLSSELVDAINLYHTLMRESDRPPMHSMSYMPYMPPQNMYGMYVNQMPNMFVPPGATNFPPNMMMQPGMTMPPGMQMPHFAGLHQGMPNPQQQQTQPMSNQQSQTGQPQQLGQQAPQGLVSLPPHMQNGHLNMTTQPNAHIMSPPSTQGQMNSVPPSQQPPTSAPPQQNQQQHHPPPPPPQQQQQIMQSHNLPQQQHNNEYQHHSLPPMNMALSSSNMPPVSLQQSQQQQQQQPQQTGIGGVAGLSQTNQIPRTTLANQTIQMQLPPPQSHQQPPQMIPPSHLIHQISGVSPIHLPPIHNMNAMPYGTIQTILPTSDSNTNIPIYQQQR